MAVVGVLAAFSARDAGAVIIERVVAVVGERPILLTELRQRARPFRLRIMSANPEPARQAALETEMFRELLGRIIDERLEEQAADKARVSVTSEEVDRALRGKAAEQKMTMAQLLGEARRIGFTEADYRDELRRQILDEKLIRLRVQGRVHVTDQDARASYAHWLHELEGETLIDARLLVLRLPAGSPESTVRARQVLAEELVARARKGENFCALVETFSEDDSTKATCGSHGMVPIQNLVGGLQDVARGLGAGETSDPIRFGAEAIVVVQVASKGKVPPFEQVKDVMTDRAVAEAIDRQRKQWLIELRQGVYVDVRL